MTRAITTQNAAGQPEDVAYTYLTAPIVEGLKDHDARLDALTQEIADLRTRLEKLEAK
jgi:uncharacterized protein YceH (UPF0502 family)